MTISHVLKSENLRPTFHPYLQIGRLLSNDKDVIPPTPSKSGVYLLRCQDCPAVYIGECARVLGFQNSYHGLHEIGLR